MVMTPLAGQNQDVRQTPDGGMIMMRTANGNTQLASHEKARSKIPSLTFTVMMMTAKKLKLINFTSEMQLNLYFIVWYDNNEDDFICEKQWQRTNEDWFHKYSCRSSRASEICQRPSLVTSVTHPQSNLYMKRWTRLVINPPRASSTDLAMWPSQNFSFSLSCSACLVNLHQAFLSSSCWDL